MVQYCSKVLENPILFILFFFFVFKSYHLQYTVLENHVGVKLRRALIVNRRDIEISVGTSSSSNNTEIKLEKEGMKPIPLEAIVSIIQEPILVMYGNKGFKNLLGNFVCNTALFPPMHSHTLVIVTEETTAEYLRSLSQHIHVFVADHHLNDAYDYETPGYLKLMMARGLLLVDLLAVAQTQGKSVVWLEPDFHYTQNLLHRPEIMETTSDLVLFWDHGMYCGCFIRFAPVPASLWFYKEIMDRMHKIHAGNGNTNDQTILNEVVADWLPNFTVFDKCLYRSGAYNAGRGGSEYEQECSGVRPVAQHHNWIIGAETKVQMAKNTGGWYLTDNNEFCKSRDMLLVVMTMNRPWSLKRLIDSLDTAVYAPGSIVDLRVTVDRDFNNNAHTETMIFLDTLAWKHGMLQVHVWPQKVGLFGQWVDSWPAELYPDNLYKAVLLLEDDLEVSPHYSRWFVGAHSRYSENRGVGAITGQRPNLVAAIEGPPSVEAVVPKGTKAFGYMLMATWSLSPIPQVWREFRRWVHDKRTDEPGFIPSVPGIVPDQWYSHFRSKGEEENMWEMWFIRFMDERRLHTVYPWVNNGKETIVGNWKEAGLHFSGIPVLDFPICQTWDDMLLEQHPLPLVGYDLEFPPMMIENQQWKPYFPQELLSIMRDSCISEMCRILADPPPDVTTTLLQVGKRYEDRERHEHWDGPDVLDLTNVVIQPEGDVEICNPVRNEQKVIGSRGCKLEDPQTSGEALCILSNTQSTQEKVIIISQMWGEGYFHALVEGLPRLISALGYLTSRQEYPADWVVHGMIDSPLAPQLAEFFGVKELIHGQHYARRALLPFPTPCGGSLGGRNTRDLRFFIDRKLALPVKPESKILVIIKRPGSRALTNHDEILSTCRDLWQAGDVIEHTGKESFLEQITLFNAASVVLGPHGAGLANAIAMRENTMMFEVLPESGNNRLNMCYAALAFSLNIRYFAVRAIGFDSTGAGVLNIHDLKQLPIWLTTDEIRAGLDFSKNHVLHTDLLTQTSFPLTGNVVKIKYFCVIGNLYGQFNNQFLIVNWALMLARHSGSKLKIMYDSDPGKDYLRRNWERIFGFLPLDVDWIDRPWDNCNAKMTWEELFIDMQTRRSVFPSSEWKLFMPVQSIRTQAVQEWEKLALKIKPFISVHGRSFEGSNSHCTSSENAAYKCTEHLCDYSKTSTLERFSTFLGNVSQLVLFTDGFNKEMAGTYQHVETKNPLEVQMWMMVISDIHIGHPGSTQDYVVWMWRSQVKASGFMLPWACYNHLNSVFQETSIEKVPENMEWRHLAVRASGLDSDGAVIPAVSSVENDLPLLKKTQSPRHILVDLGANCGNSYEFFRSYVDEAFLVEPQEQVFKKWLIPRASDNVHIFHAAVSDHDEANVPFFVDTPYVSEYCTLDQGYPHGASSLDKEKATVDALQPSLHQVELIDIARFLTDVVKVRSEDHVIMKIDIEGNEVRVLNRLKETRLLDLIDDIRVEWHGDTGGFREEFESYNPGTYQEWKL